MRDREVICKYTTNRAVAVLLSRAPLLVTTFVQYLGASGDAWRQGDVQRTP